MPPRTRIARSRWSEVEFAERSLERARPVDERKPAFRVVRARLARTQCETRNSGPPFGHTARAAQPDRAAHLHHTRRLRRSTLRAASPSRTQPRPQPTADERVQIVRRLVEAVARALVDHEALR